MPKMKIFHGSELSHYLQHCLNSINEEVNKEEKNTLLNYDESSYIDYLVKKHTIEPICFNWDELNISHEERLIPAERFPNDFSMRGTVRAGAEYPNR